MEGIYRLLDIIAPFSFLQFNFMKNAFLAVLVVTPLFAILGTMAVNNKMAFFSDALGHSAFTGIAIGALLGLENPLLSMLAFGIFLSLVITRVKNTGRASTDTVISVFSSTAMALGIVILSKNGGFARYSSYLIGDILTVAPKEIGMAAAALAVILAVWIKIYNRLLLTSINRSFAASRGINTALVENIFVVMVAVSVMLSIKWIGVLTINSLLILPAAAARNVTRSSAAYHLATLAIGLASGIIGLAASYYTGSSAGASMVLAAAAAFFITLLWRRAYGSRA